MPLNNLEHIFKVIYKFLSVHSFIDVLAGVVCCGVFQYCIISYHIISYHLFVQIDNHIDMII